MEIGYIKPRDISQEMEESYLDYAMSVIVSRALPDVRDGLKPVHRRILYAMYKLGLGAAGKFRKSATVVGEVLGKYHPHGDMAVYDSMVRMAQDFSMRYPLVNGQGNFGSLDGDSAAAMRYTEAKLTPIAEEMLADLEKNTVDFIDNYDKTRKEPVVLPSLLPQLLLNGSTGIAVGMSTIILPHNLGEAIDALAYLIDNSSASVEDLVKFIKGPDFPTGGIIYDKKAIVNTYATGRGAIRSRAKAEIAERGKYNIIQITEIPYQVNKSVLITHIADLVKDKKIEGIKDIRDESDKDGVRVIIILKNDSAPQKVLNQLFHFTDLEKVFHVNMLALSGGIQPKVLTLKMILEEFIEHRKTVTRRRSEFELAKAKARAHILEGLSKALDHIDEVIKIIKKSESREDAKSNLMSKFKLTDIQTEAILEMRLQTLAGLERKKILDELKEKIKEIKQLEDLLASPKKIAAVVKEELSRIRNKYSDERRTKVISSSIGEFNETDLIPNEEAIITITESGYIKRMKPTGYKVQERGGKGVIGVTPRYEDVVRFMVSSNTLSNILFFTNKGRAYQTKAFEIPESSRIAKGQAIFNFLPLTNNEKVTAVSVIKDEKGASGKLQLPDKGKTKYLVMLTKKGIIKKVDIDNFSAIRRSGILAISLKDNDELKWVQESSGTDEIIIATSFGQAIYFKEKDVRGMGRNAGGVRAIRLKKDDEVVGMGIIKPSSTGKNAEKLIVVMENGFGKRSNLSLYRKQKRGGGGIKTAKITPKTGKIISTMVAGEKEEKDLMIISVKGQVIRIPMESVPVIGRSTQGVRIMRLEKEDKVASVVIV